MEPSPAHQTLRQTLAWLLKGLAAAAIPAAGLTAARDITVHGSVSQSILITGDHATVIVEAGAPVEEKSEESPEQEALRILAVMAAPVAPGPGMKTAAESLDLTAEWFRLTDKVRRSNAAIALRRLAPPTLKALRLALSSLARRTRQYPHVLHFSGHAAAGRLLFEDELGRGHWVSVEELLAEWPEDAPPLDLVVLNACQTADETRSLARLLVEKGLTKAAVGHPRPVLDEEAIAFAARLYEELAHGFSLSQALKRAQRHVTTHPVVLEGDGSLRFPARQGKPHVDDGLPPGNLPSRAAEKPFFGRGKELVDLAEILARVDKGAHVVVITGHPGIGKSTLALEAAYRNAWRFRGGAVYASARGERGRATARELLAALLAALNLSPAQADVEALGQALLTYAAENPVLLVLDNLETLDPPELARLARILERLPRGSAALVTLRPPVPALEMLPNAAPYPLHRGLETEDATRYALYLAQTRQVRLTWPEAQGLAQAVGGHPRLVELALARTRTRPLRALLHDLRRRGRAYQDLLNYLMAEVVAGLPEEGRMALRVLPLFPAGWAPDEALRAAAHPGDPDLLREAALADFDPRRQAWVWHATVPEYAQHHLPLSNEERAARLAATLPAWTQWLRDLPPVPSVREPHLLAVWPNLEPVLAHLGDVADGPERADFLDALHTVLPHPERTLALREAVAAYYRVRVALSQKDGKRAGWLNHLSVALSALGHGEEAFRTAKESVRLYRRLAQADSQAFEPDLAMSLTNLARILADLGRREEALEVAKEAVVLYRRLAQANPQVFEPDLARSLTSLARILADLGRREEVFEVAKEAVALYRRLTQVRPQAFEPDLAMSLTNLARILADLGRREKAFQAAKESVRLYRRLAQVNPQAFEPDLAMSLTNLARILADLGCREKALQAAKESVRLYRCLAQVNPQVFLPNLAMSLTNLARILADLGRREKAFQAAKESVRLYRRLAQVNPQAFEPDLAMSLTNLARILAALGRREEAFQTAKESVRLYRRLAQANPQTFEPDLARSIGTLGMVLLGLGRAQEAAGGFAEGLRTLLPHVRTLPQAFDLLLVALVQSYLKACRAAGTAPDWELLLASVPLLGPSLPASVIHLAPLLLEVVALARGQGDEALQARVRQDLAQLRQTQDWQALATALQRLLEGEWDPQALTAGLRLDETDAQALALALAAATTDEGWQALVALVEGVGR